MFNTPHVFGVNYRQLAHLYAGTSASPKPTVLTPTLRPGGPAPSLHQSHRRLKRMCFKKIKVCWPSAQSLIAASGARGPPRAYLIVPQLPDSVCVAFLLVLTACRLRVRRRAPGTPLSVSQACQPRLRRRPTGG